MSPRRRHKRPWSRSWKSKCRVKLRGSLVDGVDYHGASAEVSPAAYATTEGIDEKVAAETLAPFVAVDCEASQEHDGHRVGHSSPKSRRCPGMGDGAHGQRVIAHDHVVAAQHIGGRRTC